MDLMTLAAKITLDDSSFRSGVNNTISMGENLAGRISSISVAAGQLIADVVRKGVSGIQSVISGAIDGYADYQQLVGGVETLFKGSSDKVMAYAKQSFKTTGLSANDYMETVTSFSASLLQGLGGDTEQAADLADMAIQDMADNANKMGTDLSSIQTAYQGFAKQNYTMLDNLKLGYGGTKDEMIRLVNDSGILEKKIDSLDGITFDQLVEAIHKIQEEMGITGTTATEAAETISGSKATMVAAWNDLLSAIGEGDQDRLNQTLENFKTSFTTYMQNFIPTLVTTITNSGTLIEAVADAITSIPTDALSKIAQGGMGTVEGLANGAKSLVTWIIDSITVLFKDIQADPSKIAEMGSAIGEFIGSALADIVENAPTIIGGLFTAGVSLAGSLIEGLFAGIFGNDEGIDSVFKDADKEMANSIKEAEKSSVKAEGIINYLDSLVEKYGESATNTEEWATALTHLEEVLPGATEYIKNQNGPLATTVRNLQNIRKELREQAIENAKRKALETKQDAYLDLLAQVGVKQTEIDIAQENKGIAGRELANWFNNLYKQYGAEKRFDPEEWANDAKGLTDEIDRLLNLYAKDSQGQSYDKDSEEYKTVRAQLMGWAQSLTGTDDEIEGLKKELSNLQTQLASAEAEYMRTKTALDALMSSAQGASANLSKLAMVSPKILPTVGTTGREKVPVISYTPEATGIEEVPYTGFRAELHKGEAILTKEENDARKRGGMSAGDIEMALESAIRAGMSGMYFNMNGNRVADLTTQRTGRNISASERARVRSMGG